MIQHHSVGGEVQASSCAGEYLQVSILLFTKPHGRGFSRRAAEGAEKNEAISFSLRLCASKKAHLKFDISSTCATVFLLLGCSLI
jgi:hypothetical protein